MSECPLLVAVVDDDLSVLKALARLLTAAGYAVEAHATAESFWSRASREKPACLVLDVHLPGLDGLELQRRLIDAHAEIPVVFITGRGDIPMSVQAMKGGAVDFLLKPFDDEQLLAAVRQGAERSNQTRSTELEGDGVRQHVAALTPRERQVMNLLLEGMKNRQIAEAMGVGEKTVKVHRGRVMAKMQVGSVAQLARLAERFLSSR